MGADRRSARAARAIRAAAAARTDRAARAAPASTPTRPEQRRRERVRHVQALGDQPHELLAQQARPQPGEDRPQVLEHAVLALGARRVAQGERALDPEAHERHRPLDQRAHRVGALALHQVRGVEPRRQRHDAQLELAPRRHLGRPQHRVVARRVGIQGHVHHRRELAQLADLLDGQRRAHARHRVAQPRLVQRDHVGVALAQHDRPRLGRRRPRQVRGVDQPPLVKQVVLARVEVLRRPVRAQGARAEAQHPPPRVGQREHDPCAEPVVDLPRALRALHQPRVVELARLEARA